MQQLVTWAAVLAVVLASPIAVSAYTFGEWASDNGYSPGDAMPSSVDASSALIDSLSGIGDYNWIATPTTELRLNDNLLTDIEADAFSGVPELTYLSLGSNLLTSIETDDFLGLSKLDSLTLATNQISNIESGSFRDLTNLTSLSLSSNSIGNISSDAFMGLGNLERLYFDSNGVTAIEAGDFSELQNLQMLFLGFNRITSIEAGDFAGPENLTWLYLHFNLLESLDAGDLAGLESVEKLSLHANRLSRIDPGALSGLHLDGLFLGGNQPFLTNLDLTGTDLSRMDRFDVAFNDSITSVSLKNSIINQASLAVLMDSGYGYPLEGIGDLRGVKSMNLSGIDFDAITDLSPLYVMDDLTDLWLAGTENLSAVDLDTLLDNLETIEGTATEGVLYMTQSDFDNFNASGGGMLAAWDAEPGHHVSFVVPGDYNFDGHCNALDFLIWQRNPSIGHFSDWESNYGSPLTANSAAVPEPSTLFLALITLSFGLARYHR